MRRTTVVTALALSLLAPAPAFAQEAATPTAGVSPSPSDTCNNESRRGPNEVTYSNPTIVAGDTVTYSLYVPGPWTKITATIGSYSWTTPSSQGGTPVVSRTDNGEGPFSDGEGASRSVTFRPTTNTKISWSGTASCASNGLQANFGTTNSPLVVNVAPRHTIDAVRNAARDYTFTGTSTRPGMVLNLYRVTDSGSQVLTSQTRTAPDGNWTINRKFSGSGRFGFLIRTGRDMANAPGVSRTRDTVIH